MNTHEFLKRNVILAGALIITGALLLFGRASASEAPQEVKVNSLSGDLWFKVADIAAAAPVFERAYHSQSPQSGMFGLGWASTYENHFELTPEGNLLVYEYALEKPELLLREDFSAQELEDMVARILDSLPAQADSGADREQLRNRLLFDPQQRILLAKKAGIHFRDDAPEEHVWTSPFCGHHTIKLENNVWIKKHHSLEEQYRFDNKELQGYVVKISRDEQTWDIMRNEKNAVTNVTGPDGVRLEFSLNKDGTVESIKASDNQTIRFQYRRAVLKEQGKTALLASISSNNRVTARYGYTPGARPALSTISQGKKKILCIYDGDEHRAIKITLPDGHSTAYEYWSDAENPETHRGVEMHIVSADKRQSQKKISYWLKRRPEGITYFDKMEEKSAGSTVTTVYCEYPLQRPRGIIVNDKVTTFTYTPEGQLASKKSPDGTLKVLQYDLRHWKVSFVTFIYPSGIRPRVIEYNYDESGNLVKAIDHNNTMLTLTYDRHNLITSIAENNGPPITFVYDEKNKLRRLAVSNNGGIDVVYDLKGNIADVKIQGDYAVSYQIQRSCDMLMKLASLADIPLTATEGKAKKDYLEEEQDHVPSFGI